MNEALHTLSDLDRVIHEPSRLLLVALLSSLESADFLFLLKESRLTKGNLTVHLSKLEEAGYIQIEKDHPRQTAAHRIPADGSGPGRL